MCTIVTKLTQYLRDGTQAREVSRYLDSPAGYPEGGKHGGMDTPFQLNSRPRLTACTAMGRWALIPTDRHSVRYSATAAARLGGQPCYCTAVYVRVL